MNDTDPRRYTVTVTPMTPGELAAWIEDLRARHGRKHLIHVIAEQASGTHLRDAPRTRATSPAPEGGDLAGVLGQEREACGGSECCDPPDHGHVPWSIAQRGGDL